MVMRERIFRSVDFPAPLRPMMPTTSPRLTSKETSLRAQNVSGEAGSGKREVGSELVVSVVTCRLPLCAYRVTKFAERCSNAVGDNVTQSFVAFALTNAVALA